MNLMKKAKYVLNGEDGAISVEMVGWIAIICVILVAAFILRDQIISAVNRGGSAVDNLDFGTGGVGGGGK